MAMAMATDAPIPAFADDRQLWTSAPPHELSPQLSFDASLLDDPIVDTSMQDPPPALLPSGGSHSGLGLSISSRTYSPTKSPANSPEHSSARTPTPPPPVISSALDDGSDSAFRVSRFEGQPGLTVGRGSSSFRMSSPKLGGSTDILSREDFGYTGPSAASVARSRLSSHAYPSSPSLQGVKPGASPPTGHTRDRYAQPVLRRSSDERAGQHFGPRDPEPRLQSWSSSRLSSGSEVSGEAYLHTHRPAILPHSRYAYETPRLAADKRVLRSAATSSALRPTRHAPWSTTKTPFRAQRVPVYVDPEEGADKDDHSLSLSDKENKPTPSSDADNAAPATFVRETKPLAVPSLASASPPDRAALSDRRRDLGNRSRQLDAELEPRSGSHLPGYELGAGVEEDEADNEEQGLSLGPRQPSGISALPSALNKGLRVSSAGVAEMASSSSQLPPRSGMAARAVSQPPPLHQQLHLPAATTDSNQATLESLPIEEATAVLARTSEHDKFSLYEREVLTEAGRQASYEPERIAAWLGKSAGKDWKDFKPTTVNGLRYRKIRKAGEGGFSTVWVVRGPFERADTKEEYADHQQAFFAMKQVNLKKLEPQSRADVLKEAEHLEALSRRPGYDKYMLRYFAHKANDSHLKILIELGDCDFSDILRRQQLSRWQIPKTFGQMCEAVHFLHTAGIVHTDLKPANFLRAGDSIKIIDLGIAQKIPKGTIHISREALVGTPNYMAPETVKLSRAAANGTGARPAMFKAGIASDVWAMGCILYQLVYGRPPFDKLTGEAKLRAIVSEKTVIEFPPTRPPPYPAQPGDEGELVDDALLDAMKSALQYSVAIRATLPSLLAHPLMAPHSRATETAPVTRETMYLFLTRVRDLERAGRIVPGTEASMVENFFLKMLSASQGGPA